MEAKKLKVVISCNIKRETQDDAEAEFDEPGTIEAIKAAIEKGGYEAVVLEADADFSRKIQELKPDIVFNIAEGLYGRSREAQIPAILEYLGIPFVGSDAVALGVALDKDLTKRLAKSAGVSIPSSFICNQGDQSFPFMIRYPVIVKPNAEGSSKGISDQSVCQNEAELLSLLYSDEQTYHGDFLVESYIEGREFTVGILGNGKNARAFEPMELIFKKLRGQYNVYSYEVKRNFQEYVSYRCPPDLERSVIEEIKDKALKVFQVLGCRDFARMDFRLGKDKRVYFIEANPLPGLAPHYSDYPMLTSFNGISYEDTVLAVLKEALFRYGLEKRA